jgi:imidazolonepropionase-like amidohydrolase
MLAVRGARLFDGTASTYLARPTVLVDEGRIVAVQSGGDPPAEAQIVDLGDVTLLPGLIDSHVHLTFDAGPDPLGWFTAADAGRLRTAARDAARTALAAGITTVRDLGDRGYVTLRLRDEIAAMPGGGPRILAAGPPITSRGGHCYFLGGEVGDASQMRTAVREHAERGVDVIKVMATGGELTAGTRSHEAQFGTAAMKAAVEEAHRLGLPVTAHAHGAPGILTAVAAGVDSIEHVTWLTEDSAAIDEPAFEVLLRSGIVVDFTPGVLPTALPKTRMGGILPLLKDNIGRMIASGIRYVVASDGGVGPAKPHDVLPYSIAVVASVTGSPVDALRAATSRAAELCRVGDRAGRLAAGYDADILAVHGDPLADVAALRSVAAVFRAGVTVLRDLGVVVGTDPSGTDIRTTTTPRSRDDGQARTNKQNG